MTWDQLRHFHRQPGIITWWQRLWGPVLPWMTPGRRRWLLALGAIVIAVTKSLKLLRPVPGLFGFTPDSIGSLLVILAMAGFVWGWYRLAQRFASLPVLVKRHPQLCLHGTFWIWLVGLGLTAPASVTVRTTLCGGALVFSFLLWRLGYLLLTAQRGRMAGTTFVDHWFYLWPTWGGANVPYGKGLDYLKTCEAQDAEALARSQLAGLKLFFLAALCGLGKGLIDGLVFGEDNPYRRALGGLTLGVAGTEDMIAAPVLQPLWKSWVAIYGELFRLVMGLGARGHVTIGLLRLFGFYVFRNTYKPLLAESIVEFWNRYYYYFKELLVNFFFFPTFTRYFKPHPRLRVAAAVFAAACFGNMYYHVIKAPALMQGQWAVIWAEFNPRLLYCLALALGIYVSMQREQRRPKVARRPPARRALAMFGVWTFFSVIHLWASGTMTHAQRFHFLLGLFGLG